MKPLILPPDKPLVIAEIALAHDGSLGNAIAYIRACAGAGAGAVKFQCHDGDPNDVWREGVEHPQDETRQEYWRRTAFTATRWKILRNECHEKGVWFGVTPFSHLALHSHAPLCDFIKIARQFFGTELHEHSYAHEKPVLCTGSNDGKHHDRCLGLDWYDTEYHIGISCHAPSIEPALDAVRRGAMIVEKHICWDRRQFGPDTEFSITIDELAELCKEMQR